MIKRLLAILVVASLFTLCGCNGDSQNFLGEEQEEAGEDIAIYSYKADTFCPIASDNQANIRMLGIVYEGLISLNDTLMPEPCLAENWKSSANCMEWTFNLRNNALWHSGGECTAQDVVYTVEQIKKSEKSAYSYNVSNIAEIKAASSHTVKITLSKPLANFVNLMYFPIIKKSDGELDLASFKPDGTGPYIFEDRGEGNICYLVSNKNWWGGYTVAKTIKVRMLPGGETALYAFSSGTVDIAPTDNMDWGKFVDPQADSYIEIPTPVYNFLGINHSDTVLGAVEIREAISMAIDRNMIVEKSALGYAEPAGSPVREKWFVRGNQIFDHSQNTNAAKKLLEENGWRFDSNIYRKSIDGVIHQAQFNILVNEENTIRENIAGIIKDNLEVFGIKVSITKLPFEEYTKRIQNGEYDAFVGSVVLSPDLDFAGLFGEENNFGFTDEEMLSVMYSMQLKSQPEDIQAGYAEFINLFEQINPVVGLFFENTVMIYSKRINEDDIKPSYFDMYRGIETMHKGEAK